MKAVVYTQYGSPETLQLKEIQRPIAQDDEVLIKVQATTVNRTDCATIRAKPWFMRLVTELFAPSKHIPGTSFAGDIEAVGKNVLHLNVGERVFGFDDQGSESQAEYMTIRADKVMSMPNSLSYEQAAASVEGVHYAYNFINKIDLQTGQQVLVNGATGAIGSAAVQLLKYFGAQVTAVCATKHVELVKSLGADRVIDYTKDDFTKDQHRYDCVFDTVGKSSFFKCQRLLKPGGVYISSDLGYLAQNLILPLITPLVKSRLGNKTVIFPTPKNIKGSLQLVKKLIKCHQFKPVIDTVFPLDHIVEAYQYVGTGQKTGNVVIVTNHCRKN